jgi:ABC-type Fe3+/spermidine/putrescine transport system ATPase subunit
MKIFCLVTHDSEQVAMADVHMAMNDDDISQSDTPEKDSARKSLISDEHITSFIFVLQADCTRHRKMRWSDISVQTMKQQLSTLDKIGQLTSHELLLCLAAIPLDIQHQGGMSYSSDKSPTFNKCPS